LTSVTAAAQTASSIYSGSGVKMYRMTAHSSTSRPWMPRSCFFRLWPKESDSSSRMMLPPYLRRARATLDLVSPLSMSLPRISATS